MRTAALRFLDRTLGALACVLFLPLILLLRGLRGAEPPARPRRVLFLKFFGMGSLLRAWPLFDAAKRRYPGAELHLLTFRANRELASRLGIFDRLLTVDPARGLRLVPQVLARMGSLAAGRYELVVDLEFFSNFSAFLSLITLAPVRVGYARPGLGAWIQTRAVPYDASGPVSRVFASLARSIDAPAVAAWPPPLASRPGDAERAARLLAEAGVGERERVIVVNPASSDLSLERRWPADRFAWVCDALEGRARAVFVGAAGERAAIDDVASRLGRARVVNLAGRTDLGALLALIRRASAVLTNDSGPAHLADALGTPAVVLYGPESPVHYGLAGPGHVLFHLGLGCSPCLNVRNRKTAPCGGRNACMQLLPKEEVLEAVDALLDGRPVPAERRARWNGFEGAWRGRDWRSA